MTAYEYTVLPAPDRGEKAKGAKTPTERFALSLTSELNRLGADGWEYIRAETLPTEERSGLTSRTTVYHNILVFRRPLAAEASPVSEAVSAPFSQPMRVTTLEPAQIENQVENRADPRSDGA